MTLRRISLFAALFAMPLLGYPVKGHADNPQTNNGAAFGANVAKYPVNKVKGCQLTCGTSATAIACTTPGFTVRSRTVCNTSDTNIYISGADVTTSAGFLLLVNSCMGIPVDPNAATALVLDCAVSGGGKALSVLEGG